MSKKREDQDPRRRKDERSKITTYRVQPFRTSSELLLVESSIRVVEDDSLIPDLHVLDGDSSEELSVQPFVRLSLCSNETTSQGTEVGLRRVLDDDRRDLRVKPPLSVVDDLRDRGSVDSAEEGGR